MAFGAQKRKHERTDYTLPLRFSLSVIEFERLQKVNSDGIGFDISESGMGFVTDFPLEPGHILRIERESADIQTAMVKWVNKIEGRYHVGVLFYS